MAKKSSFDVSTGVDLQEVDNAVNQARKEIATRNDNLELSPDIRDRCGVVCLDADSTTALTVGVKSPAVKPNFRTRLQSNAGVVIEAQRRVLVELDQ